MITKCFAVISLLSIAYAVVSGNTACLTNAVIDGGASAVRLALGLCGMSCLWCGIMQVFSDSGILDKVSAFLSPVLGRIFPNAWKSGAGKREITASISANLLGIGNAATPYALRAMEELDKSNLHSITTSPDMAMFVVLGTASFNIVPTTLITLLRSAGSSEPAKIIVPIWICSLMCAAAAITGAKLCSAVHTSRSGGSVRRQTGRETK